MEAPSGSSRPEDPIVRALSTRPNLDERLPYLYGLVRRPGPTVQGAFRIFAKHLTTTVSSKPAAKWLFC